MSEDDSKLDRFLKRLKVAERITTIAFLAGLTIVMVACAIIMLFYD
ncbi:MAG: hypothetical protein JXB35_10460 [Anaerolineae bacterium]|nr:hypothetical protein [Anaerolineae bacterium]